MTPSSRHEARLECRNCGFPFGTLSRDRAYAELTAGLRLVVKLSPGEAEVEVICPDCGARRSFTDVMFPAMTVPRLPERHRAKIRHNN